MTLLRVQTVLLLCKVCIETHCSDCIKLSLWDQNWIIGSKIVNYFVFSDDDWSENSSVPKKKKSKRSSAESAIDSSQKMQKEGMLGFHMYKMSSGNPRTTRQPPDSYQTVNRQPTDSHQTANRQPADSYQTASRQPEDSQQTANRQLTDNHQKTTRQPLDSSQQKANR